MSTFASDAGTGAREWRRTRSGAGASLLTDVTLVGTVLGILLLLSALLAATQGASQLDFAETWAAILDPGSASGRVLYALRLPRIVLAVVVGAALGASGASMQSLFRNPLADPGLIGISGGATLGIAAVLWLSSLGLVVAGNTAMVLAGFFGSLGATAVVWQLAGRRAASTTGLILAGVAMNAAAGAMLGLFSYVSDDRMLRNLTMWTLGSLGGATWRACAIGLLLSTAALVALASQSRRLDILQLGEVEAELAGVDVGRLRRFVVVLVALLTGCAVSLAGLIGFVGLVVPHLIRLCGIRQSRQIMALSAIGGALLLVNADTVSRTLVAPAEIPVGILSALVGTPVLVWLLRRSRGDVGAVVRGWSSRAARRGADELRRDGAMASRLDADRVQFKANARTLILDEVTSTFRSGRLSVVLGPSGAGKSSLVKVLSGELAPTGGSALLDGRPLRAAGRAELSRRRAVVAQHAPSEMQWSAREIVLFGRLASQNRDTETQQDADVVQRALLRARAQGLTERQWPGLSGGERSRVMLARALAQVDGSPATPWILADEPTAALDPAQSRRLIRQLKRLAVEDGYGVVVVMHDLALAFELADDLVIMNGGRVVAQGPPQQALSVAVARDVFDLHATHVVDSDGNARFHIVGETPERSSTSTIATNNHA